LSSTPFGGGTIQIKGNNNTARMLAWKQPVEEQFKLRVTTTFLALAGLVMVVEEQFKLGTNER